MPSISDVKEILVLEPDRLCGAIIAQTAAKVFPQATIHIQDEPAAAAVTLAENTVDLFIVAVRGFDFDIITLLGVWAEHDVESTRVLVVTPDVNSSALAALQSLPISGVFDSSWSDLRELEFACRAIASGRSYWSGSVRARIGASRVLPVGKAEATFGAPEHPAYIDCPRVVLPRLRRSPGPPQSRM